MAPTASTPAGCVSAPFAGRCSSALRPLPKPSVAADPKCCIHLPHGGEASTVEVAHQASRCRSSSRMASNLAREHGLNPAPRPWWRPRSELPLLEVPSASPASCRAGGRWRRDKPIPSFLPAAEGCRSKQAWPPPAAGSRVPAGGPPAASAAGRVHWPRLPVVRASTLVLPQSSSLGHLPAGMATTERTASRRNGPYKWGNSSPVGMASARSGAPTAEGSISNSSTSPASA